MLLIAERPARAGISRAAGNFPAASWHAAEPREGGDWRASWVRRSVSGSNRARPLIQIRHRYPDRKHPPGCLAGSRNIRGTPSGLRGTEARVGACVDRTGRGRHVLPADRPVIAALRLPARLMAASSDTYDLIRPWHGGFPASGRLRGAWCADAGEALAAAAAGAEFLALGDPLGTTRLAALCDAVNVPVFARDIPMAMAWALGATGVNEVMAS